MTLIRLSDMQTIRNISGNIDETKNIIPLITEAEEIDLKPVLNSCGKDFLARIRSKAGESPVDAEYALLLNGGTYTNSSGDDISFMGLKHALKYYSLSRIVESMPIHFTPTGVVQKRNQYSENIDEDSINRQIQTYRTAGWAYMNDVVKFLNEKRTTFAPYWGSTGGVRTSTPNITAVG